MAQSPTHKFGQIIGDLLERTIREPLAAIARKHGLYLDYKHPRPVRQGKSKAAWRDDKGNLHDLDFVFEAGGSEDVLGRPKAFIEAAYRRYTKHSRNKAQEMQGAIIPLAETYANDHPFLGVVLAGVFTEGSVAQLRSHGFGVLFFPFASIVAAFEQVGIDASFDESSTDRSVQRKVAACAKLREADWAKVVSHLHKRHKADLTTFLGELESSLTRTIQTVFVLALHHGGTFQTSSVAEAIQFIKNYDESKPVNTFHRYEVNVRYTNGDEVRGAFASRIEAIGLLEGLR